MKKNQLRRTLLIVMICLLSVLLVADILYGISGTGDVQGVPGFSGFSDDGTAGFTGAVSGKSAPSDGGSATDGDSSGQADNRIAELPSDSNFPNFSETKMDIPGKSVGVLQKMWVLFALLLALCDGICIFWLIHFGKQTKTNKPQPDMPELQPSQADVARHRSVSMWVTAVALLLTFALILSAMPSGNSADETEVNTKVFSAKLSTQTISTVLSGTGTLAAAEGTEVTVPSTVSVKIYHVKNGDIVSNGDILATVSQVEAASAAKELQGILDELDEDLTAESKKTADTSVKSAISGRVKEILVQAGDNVADVMYNCGALMLLSLDGTMSVDIESENLQAGDSVQVIFSDGSIQTGKVAQILDGVATVTTSDETAAAGDTVTVADTTGNILGCGALSIHNPLKITAFSGTVGRICVSANQIVSADSTLITLEDTGYTTEYYRLLARRQQLEETMVQLTRLSVDGFLRAECAGQVSGIPEDSTYRALNTSDSLTADSMAMMGDGHVVLLSQTDTEREDSKETEETENPIEQTAVYAASVCSITGNAMVLSITVSPVDLTTMDAKTALETLPTQELSCIYDETVLLTDTDGTPLQPDELVEGDILEITVSSIDGSIRVNAIRRVKTAEETPVDPIKPDDSSEQKKEFDISDSISIPSGMGASSVQTQASYDAYENGETRVLTITPQEEMTVDIQVDELDILSLQTGLDAVVSLDAVEGQSFIGTVSGISKEGKNQGGNTKFTVQISIAKNENMLPGMNASVKVVTAESSPVLTLPAAALVEDGNHTYVYLSYDEKEDLLSDLTEVETGLSDGENVQIVSGISEDSTVYYRYADSVVYNFTYK